MSELKKDAAYKNLQSRLNNLLQLNTETILSSTFDEEIQKFLTRDYYVKNTTIILNNRNKKDFKRENRMNLDKFVPSLNRTQLGEEISAYRMPFHIVLIVVILAIILTCCCTLYLRNKLMALVYKVVGKKKKDRLSSLDLEKGRRESKNGLMGVKKIQKKEIKPGSPDVTQPVPQLPTTMTTTSSIQAEPSPTGCCKCFKKKRKKTRKKHKR